jgi:hypothetical protein
MLIVGLAIIGNIIYFSYQREVIADDEKDRILNQKLDHILNQKLDHIQKQKGEEWNKPLEKLTKEQREELEQPEKMQLEYQFGTLETMLGKPPVWPVILGFLVFMYCWHLSSSIFTLAYVWQFYNTLDPMVNWYKRILHANALSEEQGNGHSDDATELASPS